MKQKSRCQEDVCLLSGPQWSEVSCGLVCVFIVALICHHDSGRQGSRNTMDEDNCLNGKWYSWGLARMQEFYFTIKLRFEFWFCSILEKNWNLFPAEKAIATRLTPRWITSNLMTESFHWVVGDGCLCFLPDWERDFELELLIFPASDLTIMLLSQSLAHVCLGKWENSTGDWPVSFDRLGFSLIKIH